MNECKCREYGGVRSARIYSYNTHVHDSDKRYASSLSRANSSLACIICKSRNICTRGNIVVPDTCNRVVRRVNLCSRHTPPDHVLGTITSFDDVARILRL